MAALIVSEGPKAGSYFPLGKRTSVIGRQETCTVQIVDDRISRKHVQIHFDPATNQFMAMDMKSGNGTFVNGNRVTVDTPLRDFDQIKIGDSVLVFIAADFPDQQSALEHYKTHGQRNKTTM